MYNIMFANNNNDNDLEEVLETGFFCLCFWVKYSIKRTFIDTINNSARVLPIAEINQVNLSINER